MKFPVNVMVEIIEPHAPVFFSHTLQSGNVLKNDLKSININVTINETTFTTQSNVFNQTDSDLFPAEIRVYILNMYPLHARRIMCKVRERNAYFQ